LFIDEVIGAGEIAISDDRSAAPTSHEIARVAHDVFTSGKLSKKSGRVHFHVGDAPSRLQILREMVERYSVKPEWLYPTHISRNKDLMHEAIEMAKQGSYVDIDTVDEDLPEQLEFYLNNGGPEDRLTLSLDAAKTSPRNLFEQVRSCILEHNYPIERILPFVTSNTAKCLKLPNKGMIAECSAADILVIEKDTFELRYVLSAGRTLFADGKLAFKEAFLKEANRKVLLEGEKEAKKAKNPQRSPSAKAAR
jgi:beta-aspartyl-dipeptidase (metallo-type)